MVQIKENWTDVKGRITRIAASPDRPSFKAVSILVDEAQPVDGFSNFLADAAGKTIVVNVAADTVQAVSMNEGGQIRCRIRRGRKLNDLFAKGESVVV
jgi:D-serine deaminase-like pyridoxal phosphate-dependent protein